MSEKYVNWPSTFVTRERSSRITVAGWLLGAAGTAATPRATFVTHSSHVPFVCSASGASGATRIRVRMECDGMAHAPALVHSKTR